MKRIAIIFNHAPHGSANGREALDLSLALSDIHHISIFFINDGVFHLLPNQQPDQILMRDYLATFNMLTLYDINNIYVCASSLKARKLNDLTLTLEPEIVTSSQIADLLIKQDTILQL